MTSSDIYYRLGRIEGEVIRLRSDFNEFRTETKTELKAIRNETKAEFKAVRTEIKDVRDELHRDIQTLRSDMFVAMGLIFGGLTLVIAIAGLYTSKLHSKSEVKHDEQKSSQAPTVPQFFALDFNTLKKLFKISDPDNK